MDNKLKPCPFCGSTTAPSLLRGDEITECDENEHSDSWAMVCDAHNGGCGAASGYHVNPDSAVQKWNDRAAPAARGPVLSGGIPNPKLDADWDWIETEARRTHRHHQTQVRGTTLTRADDPESHVVWATLAWVRNLLERAKPVAIGKVMEGSDAKQA